MKDYTVPILSAWFFFALAVAGGGAAKAESSQWVTAPGLKGRLVSVGSGSGEDRAYLEIDLEPEWHMYWRNPGDTGLAPNFDWSRSRNVEDIKVDWPVPERFENFGIYSFGYKDSVVFPLTIKRGNRNADTDLALEAQIMVCNNICIPGEIRIDLPLKGQGKADAEALKAYESAREHLPLPDNTPGLKIETAVAGPEAFVVTVFMQHGADELDLYVEAGDVPLNSPPEVQILHGDMRRAMLRIAAPQDAGNLAAALEGKEVVVTLVNRGKAVERHFSF